MINTSKKFCCWSLKGVWLKGVKCLTIYSRVYGRCNEKTRYKHPCFTFNYEYLCPALKLMCQFRYSYNICPCLSGQSVSIKILSAIINTLCYTGIEGKKGEFTFTYVDRVLKLKLVNSQSILTVE